MNKSSFAARNWASEETLDGEAICNMLPLMCMVNHDAASQTELLDLDGTMVLINMGEGIQSGHEVALFCRLYFGRCGPKDA